MRLRYAGGQPQTDVVVGVSRTVPLERAHSLTEAVEDAMSTANISKVEMAKRMRTSRSQLDRILDPDYTAVQLDTLIKAASAVGQELRVSFRKIRS